MAAKTWTKLDKILAELEFCQKAMRVLEVRIEELEEKERKIYLRNARGRLTRQVKDYAKG